jgi:hypothetical protein
MYWRRDTLCVRPAKWATYIRYMGGIHPPASEALWVSLLIKISWNVIGMLTQRASLVGGWIPPMYQRMRALAGASLCHNLADDDVAHLAGRTQSVSRRQIMANRNVPSMNKIIRKRSVRTPD